MTNPIILTRVGELTDSSLVTLKAIIENNDRYFDSETIKSKTKSDGRTLGSTLSAISKQFIDEKALIVPFGKKSQRVKRERNGEVVEISMPVQVWEVNQILLDNKNEILERINQILKVLQQ